MTRPRLLRGAAAGALAALAAVVVVVGHVTGRHAPPPRPVANRAFLSTGSAHAAAVWAVGDGADGGAAAKAVARRIAADRPARLLYLGDVYEFGSAQDFRRHYATVYGALSRVTAPTPGNHDWPAHTDGYDRYWTGVTRQPTPPWYAFHVGGWRVVSLNSEAPLDPGSAQLRWLQAEMRRSSGTCTLAFWHRPLQSAGRHGDQTDVAPLWDALRGHATLVVNGHDHDSQRMRPRDGITQLVAGAGGKSRYGIDQSDRRLAFGDDRHDAALRMRLGPGRVQLSFVTADGTVLDRSSAACAPAR